MLALKLSKQVGKFLNRIPTKHAIQISNKIELMRVKRENEDAIELKGYFPFCRSKSGEYRIIFKIEDETLFVVLIGKRNDDEIYRKIKRILR